MKTPTPFTREYFLWEVNNLRQLWGKKSFWDNIEQALSAFEGLLVVYAKTPDLTDRDITTMEAVKQEFDFRLKHSQKQNEKG